MKSLTVEDFLLSIDCPVKVKWKRDNLYSLLRDDCLLAELDKQHSILRRFAQRHECDYPSCDSLNDLLRSKVGVTWNVFLHDVMLPSPAKDVSISARFDIVSVAGPTVTLSYVSRASIDCKHIIDNVAYDDLPGTTRREILKIAFQSLALESYIDRFVPIGKSTVVTNGDHSERFYNYHLISANLDFPQTAECLRQGYSVFNSSVETIYRNSPPTDFFHRTDVTRLVNEVQDRLTAHLLKLVWELNGTPFLDHHDRRHLSPKCATCEYRMKDSSVFNEVSSGFGRCWGAGSYSPTHIVNFPLLSSLTNSKYPHRIDEITKILRAGSHSMFDVPEKLFIDDWNRIQHRTIESIKSGSELISRELIDFVHTAKGAVSFVLPTVYRAPLSLWEGSRFNDSTAFQLSCHTISSTGDVTHARWIHLSDNHPAMAFLLQLREMISGSDVIVTWGNRLAMSVTRAIEILMPTDDANVASLVEWASSVLYQQPVNIVDMQDLARRHYVHPAGKGDYTLAGVFDPIWRDKRRQLPAFLKPYSVDDENEGASTAFTLLPAINGTPGLSRVSDNRSAQVAYFEMLYGSQSVFADVRSELENAINQFATLQTAAMAFIWLHWARH